jgi:3D (Asp-Asp-Asp) domain-containing protein
MRLLPALLLFAAALPCAASAPARLMGAHALGRPIVEAPAGTARVARVKATGYCPCGHCCSWTRSWFGLGPPVISAGPNRGRPKEVGVTAARTKARPGVIAADTNLFAFGTVIHVPGYGWGRVEDIGGAIKGYHLDLYFTTHTEAREWGVQRREIRFWRPPGATPKGVKLIKPKPKLEASS